MAFDINFLNTLLEFGAHWTFPYGNLQNESFHSGEKKLLLPSTWLLCTQGQTQVLRMALEECAAAALITDS